MYPYVMMPFIAWLAAGSLKFAINYVRFGKDALRLVGNGGFPSTHTTIAASTTMLIGFTEGFETDTFGLALTVLCLFVIDALGIRRAVGRHAEAINKYFISQQVLETKLRERQGHNRIEILGGLVLGTLLGLVISILV